MCAWCFVIVFEMAKSAFEFRCWCGLDLLFPYDALLHGARSLHCFLSSLCFIPIAVSIQATALKL